MNTKEYTLLKMFFDPRKYIVLFYITSFLILSASFDLDYTRMILYFFVGIGLSLNFLDYFCIDIFFKKTEKIIFIL